MPQDPSTNEPQADGAGVSRRGFLVGGLGAAAAAAAFSIGLDACSSNDTPAKASGEAESETVPFYGAHQAGIATPAQDRLAFATFDADASDRGDLRQMLMLWTTAAAAMTRGERVPGRSTDENAPPADTGEASGLSPGRLTITIGYGPKLFDGRYGLAAKRPKLLAELPSLPNENLNPAYVGGDIAIQACSDDPIVAFHALRDLARIGIGTVSMRWMQIGFGSTSRTSTPVTPRNLLGFKDGTRNIDGADDALMRDHVWIGAESDQPWLRDGSFLVTRQIRMFLENWDRDRLGDQENVIGRNKDSGAPLSGHAEFDTPDFDARGTDGELVIPADAHIRLASPEHNDGVRIRRRGYSYTDGIDPVRGTLLGGLFFAAYMQSPEQFVTLQRMLGHNEALREYIQHTGSGVFVCPPGLREGQDWSSQLFGA
jgi:deferrochelatase/peroxidase EfeB